MTTDGTTGLATRVLAEFDPANWRIEPLESAEHCIAKVAAESGCYFLKILASGCTDAELRSRLQLTDFLREGGLPIPAAAATRSGERYARVVANGQERFGVLSQWIDGETLGDRTDAGTIERCGALLARLHVRSQAFEPGRGFSMRAWDDVYAPPEEGWLRRFVSAPSVDDAVCRVIESAACRTRAIESRLPRECGCYGPIHADFHGDNLIDDGEKVWIVDLDDLGWGHFLFDVAWSAALFAKHHPGGDDFLTPFLHGYERLRPLCAAERELLPEFKLAAGLGILEMIDSSPMANDSPKAREWFEFAVNWLRGWWGDRCGGG